MTAVEAYKIDTIARKILQEIYSFLNEYGDFCLDYEGCVERLGDEVAVRAPIVLFRPSAPFKRLIVDQVIPHSKVCLSTWDNLDCVTSELIKKEAKIIIRYIIDNVKFSEGGYLVLQYSKLHGFIYGFKGLS